jgi:hypothetical protein
MMQESIRWWPELVVHHNTVHIAWNLQFWGRSSNFILGSEYVISNMSGCFDMKPSGSQRLRAGAALSCHAAVSGAIFLGCEAPGLDILHGVDHLGTCKTKSYMEKLVFTEGMFIRRQSYHDDYTCIFDRVAMPGSDVMDS